MSWPRRAGSLSCGRPCSATPGRWRSPPPRSTRSRPRLAAPGTPGLRGCWWAASAAGGPPAPDAVLAGHAADNEPAGLIDELRLLAKRAKFDLLAGVHGHRLVVVLGGLGDPMPVARQLAARFGPGPVVVGPAADTIETAAGSARAALAGLRSAPAWPDALRPVLASQLLPE